MYEIDGNDEVIRSAELPQPSPVPEPRLVCNERRIVLVYLTASLSAVVVRFSRYRFFNFGWPNEEALHGHPLYERGLGSCSASEVMNSSLIRKLEQLNSLHPRHIPGLLQSYRHFVICFQDSTFECVAREVAATVVSRDTVCATKDWSSFLDEK